MPKVKTSDVCRLRSYVQQYGESIFSTDESVLFCKVCEVKVAVEKKFTVTQHVSREKHLCALEIKKNRKSEVQTLFNTMPKNNTFTTDLCTTLVSANIPLFKLKNENFRKFLSKYTGQDIPDESTIRKNYVGNTYNDTINYIRTYVENKKLWVSIDETTDIEGRYVANVIIGTLEIGCPGKTFLFNAEVLEKTNNSTNAKLFDNSMSLLWPEGIKHDNVLLFLSDAVPYMVKAGKNIKAFYSKMEHVTCLAHSLHRVAEEIRKKFPEIDAFISNVKKIFLKCPSRVLKFKEMAPGIPMPPQPILIRWGTWLSAAIYYCENYQLIKSIVMKFDKEDAVAIENAQKLLNDTNLELNLTFIKANYGNLPKYITTLETSGLSLTNSINIIAQVQNEIGTDNSSIGISIKKKLEAVIEKNLGFKTMKHISNILERKATSRNNTILEELTADDMAYMKFAPMTSVDVERSFSRYKTTLADNRRRFTFENIKQHLIIQCYHETQVLIGSIEDLVSKGNNFSLIRLTGLLVSITAKILGIQLPAITISIQITYAGVTESDGCNTMVALLGPT
ncbi:hypothetical protein AGLY_011461 [Aphis glycines]|uniref:DUF659 domain-containing protein n=1 Tax=Aphis glycines TaxID=307491 RepID=A0A6G0TCX1_APHGL|nr:hypothetical protein AGLY_011461 [Aphis glycines]